MRSSTAVGFDAAFGRLTSIPRYIMGAVSMKIRSRASTTSTRLVPIGRGPCGSSALNIVAGSACLGGGAAQQIQEIHREAFHLDGPVLHAIDEVVVADDGGDRGAEPGRGRDQRLGDTRGHDGGARPNPCSGPPGRGREGPQRG